MGTINSATGVATAHSAGTVAITAVAKNPDGTVVTGVATFTVTTTPEPLVSMTIVPVTQTLTAAGQSAQFIAIGTTSSGATVNLTNAKATIGTETIQSATWRSSSPAVATVDLLTGLATVGGAGVTAITAMAINPNGTVVTGTATLTVNPAGEPLVSLAVVPGAQQALAINQTAHFIAIGTTSTGTTVNLTGQSAAVGSATIPAASWTSSNPAVATVNEATGVATALGAGSAAITAVATNPDGTVVTGTAVYTVSIPSVAEPLVSMAIVPASQTLALLGQTAQLTALATTGTGTTVNLTNQAADIGSATIQPAVWTSSNPGVATVNPGTGVTTALTAGSTAITAIATNPDGAVVTGTPDVIHCGPGWTADGDPGGSVCTGVYPIGTTVTVTAPARTGVAFGGWTYNCAPTAPITAAGSNSCTVPLGSTNATVGAIFNNTP